MARPESVMFELWPDGAPFAQGAADEDRPALFPYLLEGDNHAAVIVCPGGGYGRRADHEGEPIARWLNSLGISAFVLRYRVAPYKYPCALLDAQRAIRYVRHHAADLRIDAQRIGILGFSAGGHLVSTAGTHYDLGNKQADDPMERLSCRPDLLVLCYPVITMKAPYTHEGSKQNLLGEAPEDEYIQQLSNELHVTADTPSTFLWHTSEDQAVPVENSLMFASALSRAKVPFDLHVYDHGGHGLGMAEHDEHIANWTAVCGKWLKTQLFC